MLYQDALRGFNQARSATDGREYQKGSNQLGLQQRQYANSMRLSGTQNAYSNRNARQQNAYSAYSAFGNLGNQMYGNRLGERSRNTGFALNALSGLMR
jgi:hypothetical protein